MPDGSLSLGTSLIVVFFLRYVLQHTRVTSSTKAVAKFYYVQILSKPQSPGPLHFIWWIEDKYKPTSHQEVRNLNFDLAKWVREKIGWNSKTSDKRPVEVANAALHDKAFSSKVERVLFHPLSSRFLKENHFLGGSCVGLFGLVGPKGALGSQKHVEEVTEVSQEIWRFPKKFCEPTLSNLLPPARLFSNPALNNWIM